MACNLRKNRLFVPITPQRYIPRHGQGRHLYVFDTLCRIYFFRPAPRIRTTLHEGRSTEKHSAGRETGVTERSGRNAARELQGQKEANGKKRPGHGRAAMRKAVSPFIKLSIALHARRPARRQKENMTVREQTCHDCQCFRTWIGKLPKFLSERKATPAEQRAKRCENGGLRCVATVICGRPYLRRNNQRIVAVLHSFGE